MAADLDPHGILARQGAGVDDAFVAAQGCDGHQLLALIVGAECVMDLAGVEARQEDGGGHALIEVAQNGGEDGSLIQTADLLHFGQMLVCQGGAVDPVTFVPDVPVGVLIFGDQILAAAGVAGEGIGRQGEIRGKNAAADQGVHCGDEAAGVTAGVGDPGGGDDLLPVGRRQLREAVGPGGVGPVGGGGVDDPGLAAFGQGYRFDGGRVGQAQEDDVGGGDGVLPGGGILSQLLGQGQDIQVGSGSQTVGNPQAGGAGAAVNENIDHNTYTLSGL